MQYFVETAGTWLCDGYALDIRYIASKNGDELHLIEAAIRLLPVQHTVDLGFQLQVLNFEAGQFQRFPKSKTELLKILSDAVDGTITVHGQVLKLAGQGQRGYYSEMNHPDRWFYPLHIQALGESVTAMQQDSQFALDCTLRTASPPFDGLADLIAWLGLNPDLSGTQATKIDISVFPPVDLFFDQTKLADGMLRCVVHAHPNFDLGSLGLAVRAVPHGDLSSRIQVAHLLKWSEPEGGIRSGYLEVPLPNADSVQTLLSIGNATVRRQWFIDSARARNHRYLSLSQFDTDIRMVRQALFESTDPSKFEQGVAALLFMLGFAPALPIETNSPDIVVATPTGRVAVVECTIKTADFATKIGKLVDRRTSLSKALAAANIPFQVVALLVCRQPRDQMVATNEDLTAKNVLLLAGEDIERTLLDVRHLMDPDELLATGFSKYRR